MGEATEVKRPVVNIRVRWKALVAGEAIAQAVHNALSFGPSIAGYLHVKTLNSHPDYLGRTKEGYHLWSIGASLTHEQAAA